MFKCTTCEYYTDRKYNLEKHFNSNKHHNNIKTTRQCSLFTCSLCAKQYKYKKSFSKHNCDVNPNIKSIIKQVLAETQQANSVNPSTIINNYNFNINIFVNNECKQAVNWYDFIKSLHVGKSEIMEMLDTSLTASMINVLLTGINKLGKYKRPVHCLDLKRNKLCIRDNDMWINDQTQTITRITKGEEMLQHKYIQAAGCLDNDDTKSLNDDIYGSLCEKLTLNINDGKILRVISKATHFK